MSLTIKCFATLSSYQPDDNENYPYLEGDTVTSVMERLGLPQDEVHIIFINGRHVDRNAPVADGVRLGFFPAVGGG